MNEIEIFMNPLNEEEFKEHSIKGLIRKTPARYHLIDIVKNLKFGRPLINQKMMDEWIAMMELAPERGEPFSPDIVNGVWKKGEEMDDEVLNNVATSIDIDGEALNTLLYIGDFNNNECSIDDIFDAWEFEDDELQTIESLELFRGWSVYTLDNVNNDRMDHDGSMFDCELYFVDPNGNKYMIEDTHCLMTGWDFYQKVTLNLV